MNTCFHIISLKHSSVLNRWLLKVSVIAPRSTYDLRQTATDALRINTRSHDKPGMLWYHLLRAPLATTSLRNPPTRQRQMQLEMYQTRQEHINNGESKSTQYLTRFGNLPTSSGQERDFIYSTINTTNTRGIHSWDFRDTIHEGTSPYL